MKHLANAELADALGPDAPLRVTAHLAVCEDCRRRAEELRAVLEALRSDDVPDPSPVFWLNLGARVRGATASVDPPRARECRVLGRGFSLRWLLLAGAAVFLFAAVGSLALRSRAHQQPQTSAAAVESVSPAATVLQESPALDDESPWALVADATRGMDWDVAAAAGLGPSPGTSERAVSELSDDERQELMRLLEAELSGPSL